MENASKALLMAAGVLIGVLILSLAVYLFATFGASSAEIHKQNEENQLNQFNTQFTSYEGKRDITIYDIVTVVNLAKENNEYYELDSQSSSNFYISVSIAGKEYNLQKRTDSEIKDLIKEEKLIDNIDSEGNSYKKLPTYSCEVDINSTTGRVWKVVFSRN